MSEYRVPTQEEDRSNYIQALEVITEVTGKVVRELGEEAIAQAVSLTHYTGEELPAIVLDDADYLTDIAATAAPREAELHAQHMREQKSD